MQVKQLDSLLCVLQSGVSMQAAIHEEKYVIRVLYRRDPDSSHWRHHANDWHVCLAAGLGGKRGHLPDPILPHGAASLWRNAPLWTIESFLNCPSPLLDDYHLPSASQYSKREKPRSTKSEKAEFAEAETDPFCITPCKLSITGMCKHS